MIVYQYLLTEIVLKYFYKQNMIHVCLIIKAMMTYSNKSNLTFTNDLNPLLTCNYDIDLSQRDINFSLFSLTEVFLVYGCW